MEESAPRARSTTHPASRPSAHPPDVPRQPDLCEAPRIHGELLKLGIEIAETTVGHYLVRRRPPPSQTWPTFLKNHVGQIVSVDFFVVPTLTFRVLFVFIVLAHERRQILHVNVTEHPTAAWTAQQIRNAFPWDTAPRFLLRDRDGRGGPRISDRLLRWDPDHRERSLECPERDGTTRLS